MSDLLSAKRDMRQTMRAARLAHWKNLPETHRALVFSRPPNPAVSLVSHADTIGLYAAIPGEVPTTGYARFFQEQGRRLALPWFADRNAPMQFRLWGGLDEELETGPFGALQPKPDMPFAIPEAIFVPLLAFDETLARLGQGGGHYDRYLEANPKVVTIGLAWTTQKVARVPREPHDRQLSAVITEQRIFTPF